MWMCVCVCVRVRIVLLCLCIGMYRVGDETKWNDGILVICKQKKVWSTIQQQQKAPNSALGKCVSRVMNVNKVYDELHVNLLSLLFYLRVHLPFHRYSRSINHQHNCSYNLFPHTLSHTRTLPFLCRLPPSRPGLLFLRSFYRKKKSFFRVKLSYHRESKIHQFLHIVSKGISKHKRCTEKKRWRIKFHVQTRWKINGG